MADPDRISQVLYNLLIYSIKYTSQGGKVLISAKVLQEGEEKADVLVEVRDNGVGIPQMTRPIFFTTFTVWTNPATGPVAGPALAWAIVKQLVEAHGGRV